MRESPPPLVPGYISGRLPGECPPFRDSSTPAQRLVDMGRSSSRRIEGVMQELRLQTSTTHDARLR